MNNYKYIYPPNARGQEQLDIMLAMEGANRDPMAPENVDQEAQPILFQTDFWYVSKNRFPYEGARQQFLVTAVPEVYKLDDISEEMWQDAFRVWKRIVTDYGVDGGGLCMRFGNPAKSGASLTRVHFHIIEPEKGMKVKPSIGGRKELKEGLHL